MARSTVALGWDVRGWRGDKQAVAVARVVGGRDLEWLGVSPYFRFPADEPLGLESLLHPLREPNVFDAVGEADRLVVAIDAPLSFPVAFGRLLRHERQDLTPPTREIDNLLAYRDCERWIQREFGKPLSASFDKLGNNATLAIAMTHQLRREGFSIRPFDRKDGEREVIEVYPRTAKAGPTKESPVIQPLMRLLPTGLKPGTDKYDAAICALLGLVFAGFGRSLGLPDLVGPDPEQFEEDEGWIYALPSGFVHGFSGQTADHRPTEADD